MTDSRRAVDVQVSVSGPYLERVDEVAERLRAAGMTVKEVLGAIGVVQGSISGSEISRLRGIEGVGAVEIAGTPGVPPPSSDIQ